MKRILFVVSTFFVLIIFRFPLLVSASSVTLSADSISLIESSHSDLFQTGFSSSGVYPSDTTNINLINLANSVNQSPILSSTMFNLGSADYTVRTLTDTEIDNYSVLYPVLYDYNGFSKDWDEIYYVHYDNGYFNGDLYVDEYGNILTSSDNSLDNHLMYDLGFGGTVVNASEYANIYDSIGADLFEQQFLISSEGTDLSDVNLSYYLHGGRVSSGRKTEWIIYVPNIYSKGVSVAGSYTNGQSIGNIYYNDGSGVVAKAINTQGGQPFQILGSVTKDGYTYAHNLQEATYVNGTNNNRSAFESGTTGRYNFSLTSFSYNTSLYQVYDSVESFKYVGDDLIDCYGRYNWNEADALHDRLNSANWAYNEYFNPANKVSATNYPFTTSITSAQESSLPFPDSASEEVGDPAIEYDPSIELQSSTIMDSFSNLQIPFLSNLHSRFPFSIPWDIRDAFTLLRFSPEAPAWNFDWEITVLGNTYTTHFEGDLSDFTDLAELFRYLLLCGYIITLAIFSYKQFF